MTNSVPLSEDDHKQIEGEQYIKNPLNVGTSVQMYDFIASC